MGQRSIQFNNHMIEMQPDQGHPHSHLHPEPCLVYSNLPNYPHQNINFHPVSEQHHENPLSYAIPPYNPARPMHNLDLNIPPPTTLYNNNPYLTLPAGIRNLPFPANHVYTDGMRGQFKIKNAEGSSSNHQYINGQMGPSSSVDVSRVEAAARFVPPEYAAGSDLAESRSMGSMRIRAAAVVGPDPVLVHHNANVVQGNYVVPPVQLPGNPWLDMNFSGNSGNMGWGQPTPNLPYMHANPTGVCVESGNIGAQGYQVATINRGSSFVHPMSHPNTLPPPNSQRLRGYNVGHPPSRGMPIAGPFHDAGSTFPAPVPPTGFQIYGPQPGEVMLDPNMRHRGFPQFRVLPEDVVTILETPGYHGTGEPIDQHRDMRLDIDHMSYEELLALGEQIGNVGTGLSEEFIRHNLRTRSYTFGQARIINLEASPCPDQETITFCVVCQMDYEHGESIGVLDCGHEYHKDCIKKWLLVKNTCPVCKSPALQGKGKDPVIEGTRLC